MDEYKVTFEDGKVETIAADFVRREEGWFIFTKVELAKQPVVRLREERVTRIDLLKEGST